MSMPDSCTPDTYGPSLGGEECGFTTITPVDTPGHLPSTGVDLLAAAGVVAAIVGVGALIIIADKLNLRRRNKKAAKITAAARVPRDKPWGY